MMQNTMGTQTHSGSVKINLPESDRKPPVFIVGCSRSGSTMLSKVLNAHRNLCIFFENEYFNLFCGYARYHNLKDDRVMVRFLDVLFKKCVYVPDSPPVYESIDTPELREALMASDRTPKTIYQLTMDAWARHLGKPRWGDKAPNYTIRVDELIQAFPEAKIIHLVRDPRAVVCSLASLKGAPTCVYRQADVWHRAVGIFERKRRCIPEGHCLDVRYEDLVQNPVSVLQAICTFIDEPFDPDMLEFYKTNHNNSLPKLRDDYQEWQRNIDKPLMTQPVEKWKTKLHPRHIRITEVMNLPLMAKYGYTPYDELSYQLSPVKKAYVHLYRLFSPVRAWYRKRLWMRQYKPMIVSMSEYMRNFVINR